jgi:hypothetical protein
VSFLEILRFFAKISILLTGLMSLCNVAHSVDMFISLHGDFLWSFQSQHVKLKASPSQFFLLFLKNLFLNNHVPRAEHRHCHWAQEQVWPALRFEAGGKDELVSNPSTVWTKRQDKA